MKYVVDDIEIDFPFEAYPCQLKFMESVIKTLRGTTNAILESPTGTGKTLCLLCSCIAFQQYLRVKEGKVLKIVYSSRTHSQLSQVIRELRSTAYRDQVRTSVMGSRDHLCVDSSVNHLRGSELNAKCRQLVRNKTCSYNNGVVRVTGPESGLEGINCVDIEDMYKIGLARNFCPFYQSRESQKVADIVFVPYNYIVDPQENLEKQLDLTNAIVIFDEGHNLEKTCEESSSIVFGTVDIDSGLKALELATEIANIKATNMLSSRTGETSSAYTDLSSHTNELKKLENILTNLRHILMGLDLVEIDANGRHELSISGQTVAGFFTKSGAHRDHKDVLLSNIDLAEEAIAEQDIISSVPSLTKVKQVLSLILGLESDGELDKFFKIFAQDADNGPDHSSRRSSVIGGPPQRVISMYCLSASVAMQTLVQKKSMCIYVCVYMCVGRGSKYLVGEWDIESNGYAFTVAWGRFWNNTAKHSCD